MHDPWKTWRHTTGVPTHAAVTDGQHRHTRHQHVSPYLCFLQHPPCRCAIMESRMLTQPNAREGEEVADFVASWIRSSPSCASGVA